MGLLYFTALTLAEQTGELVFILRRLPSLLYVESAALVLFIRPLPPTNYRKWSCWVTGPHCLASSLESEPLLSSLCPDRRGPRRDPTRSSLMAKRDTRPSRMWGQALWGGQEPRRPCILLRELVIKLCHLLYNCSR